MYLSGWTCTFSPLCETLSTFLFVNLIAYFFCPVAQSSPKLGKSPKLLKIFHRRVHSSSAIKIQLVLEEGDTEGSPHVPGSDKNQLRVEQKLHHLPPRELAEELTLMDAELLRKIQPRELEDGAWMDKDKVSLFHSTAIVSLCV